MVEYFQNYKMDRQEEKKVQLLMWPLIYLVIKEVIFDLYICAAFSTNPKFVPKAVYRK